MKHLSITSLRSAYLSSLNSPNVSNMIPKIIYKNNTLKMMKKLNSKKYLPQYREEFSGATFVIASPIPPPFLRP